MKKKLKPADLPCPCGHQQPYQACCMRWHQGETYLQAPDAQHLMRSRYTAYVLKLYPYLQETWHPQTRPASIEDIQPSPKWMGLQIHNYHQQDENHATVEFTARYTANGKAHRMHETSSFEKLSGRWYYKDGIVT